jgi:hypothetical protein
MNTKEKRLPASRECSLMIQGFPRDLKNQFAAFCKVHNRTLKEGAMVLFQMAVELKVNPFQES